MLKSIFIFLLLSGLSLFGCISSNIPESKVEFQHKMVINVQQFKVFPVNRSKETDDLKYNRWYNIKKAFEYCIQNEYDLYFPSGLYDVGARNFPFQKENKGFNQLLDCKSITIFGNGRGTILKTSSELGADVLQLNLVKNLTIKDFDITSEISSTKRSGSNGISITNGFDNIVLDNIYIYDLPGIDKGNYIDGGKGLTLQFDSNLNSVIGDLKATNIKVKNCAYGFRFDAVSVSDLLKNNINIKIRMEADRTFQGFSMAFGVPTGNVNPTAKLNMDVEAVLTNSQQYVAFSRVIGGNYRFILDKTIDNKYINKDQKNKIWYKADPVYYAFLSNYSKNINMTITGNVGVVDNKIWMGAVGSLTEPFNLKNRTENNIFDFDIEGTCSDEDFKIIEYKGNSIHNSKFTFSPRTFKYKTDFKNINNKNNSFIMK